MLVHCSITQGRRHQKDGIIESALASRKPGKSTGLHQIFLSFPIHFRSEVDKHRQGEKQKEYEQPRHQVHKSSYRWFSEENGHVSNSSCLQLLAAKCAGNDAQPDQSLHIQDIFTSGPSISHHTDLWTFTSTIQHHSNDNYGRPCLKAPS